MAFTVATVGALAMGLVVTQLDPVPVLHAQPAYGEPLTLSGANASSVMFVHPPTRSLRFPCANQHQWSFCDPLAANRMIVAGTREEWDNYLICFGETPERCRKLTDLWPADEAK